MSPLVLAVPEGVYSAPSSRKRTILPFAFELLRSQCEVSRRAALRKSFSPGESCYVRNQWPEKRLLDRHGKHISDAALGLNDAGRARGAFPLAPQTQDLHIDAAVEHVFVDPRRLKEVLAAERACGASRKATSSAYSPLVRATGAPSGPVSRRVF